MEILIGSINSGLSYQLGDIYSIYRHSWNVAVYKWKVHYEKIDINFRVHPLLSISI